MPKSIDYKIPPVVEVVCGAAFQRLNGFKVPHVGIFWKELPSKFEDVEENPPLVYPNEPVEFANIPPHPRTWFLTSDGRELVQLQQNRFLYNWKQPTGKPIDKYPEFANIFPDFLQYLGIFRSFISDQEIGEVEFHQFELTYVNLIPAEAVKGLVEFYSDVLIDHVFKSSRSRFLPRPKTFKWVTTFALPDNLGQLHVTAESALRKSDTREELLRLELAVRGMSQDNSDDGMKSWFGVAHDWIVEGFADMTDQKVQDDVWGRKR